MPAQKNQPFFLIFFLSPNLGVLENGTGATWVGAVAAEVLANCKRSGHWTGALTVLAEKLAVDCKNRGELRKAHGKREEN